MDRGGAGGMLDEELMGTIDVSTDLVVVSVEAMGAAQVGEPSLLPDWTRGHVLAHLSRAAESLARMLEWARTGVEQPQYASSEARSQEIASGARRPPSEQAADLRRAAEAFEAAVRAMPADRWAVPVRMRSGEERTAHGIMQVRLRELEVHHVDLDLGYGWSDVPPDVATMVIEDIVATLGGREGVAPLRVVAVDADLALEVGSGGPVLTGPQADLLAWLSGRSTGEGLLVAGADEVPKAPHWI